MQFTNVLKQNIYGVFRGNTGTCTHKDATNFNKK